MFQLSENVRLNNDCTSADVKGSKFDHIEALRPNWTELENFEIMSVALSFSRSTKLLTPGVWRPGRDGVILKAG